MQKNQANTSLPAPRTWSQWLWNAPTSWRERLIHWAILLLLLGAIYCIGSLYRGYHREIFLVNGLSVPYSIEINGQEFELPAQTATPFVVAEGLVAIRVLNPALRIEPQSHPINTSFWTRLLQVDSFVINPDKTALLLWENVPYTSNQEVQGNLKREGRWHTGDAFYHFRNVGYPFQPLPDNVSLDSSATVKWCSTLRIPDEMSLGYALSIVMQREDPNAVPHFLAMHLRAAPERLDLLDATSAALPPEPFLAILREGLDLRPVRVEWHRFYQNHIEQTDTAVNLESEYKTRLNKHPQDKTLLYLYARSMLDSRKAEPCLQQAAAEPDPEPHAFNALAYAALTQGRFDEAQQYLDQALTLLPNHPSVQMNQMMILEAAGRYDAWIELLREQREQAPHALDPFLAEVRALVCAGRAEEARMEIDKYLRATEQSVDPQTRDVWRHLLLATFHYCRGAVEPYLQHAVKSSPAYLFQGHLLSGDLDNAKTMLTQHQGPPYQFLILAIAALANHRIEMAESLIDLAAPILRHFSAPERFLANHLLARTRPDADLACSLTIYPQHKIVLLTLLGLLHPTDRAQYFALAKQLNYRKDFPYLFLNNILATAASAAPARTTPEGE